MCAKQLMAFGLKQNIISIAWHDGVWNDDVQNDEVWNECVRKNEEL